ncbi:MAG TPA: hypothetical protein VLS89_16705 [Candidatus Nanopelagicales bacterium]|nr:hypothetical protein [Candidatus Nanopelagicales bacterium]
MGIVVISELPERRDTLLLRLLGAGPTLKRAIDELKALPEDALERRVMLPLLVNLRLTIPANPRRQTADDKEFLMSTQNAMALWEQRVVDRTLSPARSLLLRLYETRFGTAPEPIRTLVEATNDPEQITQWLEVVATGAREDVDRVLAAAPPAPPAARSRRRRASSR